MIVEGLFESVTIAGSFDSVTIEETVNSVTIEGNAKTRAHAGGGGGGRLFNVEHGDYLERVTRKKEVA